MEAGIQEHFDFDWTPAGVTNACLIRCPLPMNPHAEFARQGYTSAARAFPHVLFSL